MSFTKEVPIFFIGIVLAIFMVMIVLVQLPSLFTANNGAVATTEVNDESNGPSMVNQVELINQPERRSPVPSRLMLDGHGVVMDAPVDPPPPRNINPPFRSRKFGQPGDKVSSVLPRRPHVQNLPHANGKASNTGNSLYDLPDDEKNRVWWEIADASHRSGQVAFSYTLSIEQARPFAERYHVSVLEVFDFFRDGVDADWRTGTAP